MIKNYTLNFVCNSFNDVLNKEKLIDLSNIDGVDSDTNIIGFNNLNLDKLITGKFGNN